MNLFRILTPEEEVEFRQWARDNYDFSQNISCTWHPIVIDECNKIIQEIYKDIKENE